MRDDAVLMGTWWDLRNPGEPEQQQMQAIASELVREASTGHPLYGLAFTVIGRSNARDDVLLKLGDRWALVHLTWSGKPESPPWPTCVVFDSASDVEQALTDD